MPTALRSPVIDALALQDLLGSPDLLLVDCRYELGKPAWGREAYALGHIPGAIFASMDEELAAPQRVDTGRHPLPEAAAFAATLSRWGFRPASRVVAYDHGSGAWAARLWWMLRARGHHSVQVLDGGYSAWTAAGLAVDTGLPAIAPSEVEPRPFEGMLSTAEVQAALATGSITLVDARAADRFAGRNEHVDPVAGHVPGAVNHPFTGNLAPTQQFLPPRELQQRWSHVLERPTVAPIVAMCGSGITACHNLIALELAGYHGARLYAGSFSDWITDPARPVATGE